MKNINIALNPYISGAYPAAAPMPMPSSKIVEIPKQSYSVVLSAQFDDEAEAIAFAKFALNDIEAFKNGDR